MNVVPLSVTVRVAFRDRELAHLESAEPIFVLLGEAEFAWERSCSLAVNRLLESNAVNVPITMSASSIELISTSMIANPVSEAARRIILVVIGGRSAPPSARVYP